jgi:hypothetical protein
MNIFKINEFCLLLFLVLRGAYIYELAVIAERHLIRQIDKKY